MTDSSLVSMIIERLRLGSNSHSMFCFTWQIEMFLREISKIKILFPVSNFFGPLTETGPVG
jgi:hypothetical protein